MSLLSAMRKIITSPRSHNFLAVTRRLDPWTEVTTRIREAIELCLEVQGAPDKNLEFIGIQRITVAA